MTGFKPLFFSVIASAAAVFAGGDPQRAPQYEMSARFTSPEEMRIRSNRTANWFVFGEEAVFSSEKPLAENDKIRVSMTDLEGSVYLDQTISGGEFNRKGWRWKCDEPGYYEVRFELAGKGPIAESWVCPIWKMDQKLNRYVEVGRENYSRSIHSLVVTRDKARKPAEIPAAFSLCDGLNPKSIEIASLFGFHSLRLHVVDWEEIEPERGKFSWNKLDKAMELARRNGFEDETTIFNVFGVPRWASSNPEGNKIALGTLRTYKTSIPKDLGDWRNFLLELHKRYPRVRTYELWNEPHFPGYSVFWSDTPENHVKLLAAGYDALKQADPGIIVWWAGLSGRYLEFYKKFLELGGGKYFDILSIHGTWQDYAAFSRIEKENNVPVKPKVNSEWHANLIKPFQAYYPNEIQGSRKAMLGFFHMVRQGIRQIHFFTLFNSGGSELDELEANRRFGRHDPNVSGLFRAKTYTQPRYFAAAWRTLADLYSGDVKVYDSYEWKTGPGSCCVLLTGSDAGKVLLFWGTGQEELEIPAELRAAFKGATLLLPDGRQVADVFRLKLAPDYYYIVKKPDLPVVEKWTNRANVLKPYEMERPLNQEIRGNYRPAPLFDAALGLIEPQTMKFQKLQKEVRCYKDAPAGKTSAEFAAGLSEKGLDLLVRVRDNVHRSGSRVQDFWLGDSVQFSIDTQGKGRQSDTVELGASWNEKGGAKLWKTLCPLLDGDLPERYTPPNIPELRHGKVKFVREGDVSEYRIHVEPTELYSFVYTRGSRLRIAVLVNCSDGSERESYLEWGSGIGKEKDPALHGTLTVQTAGESFSQADLTRGGTVSGDVVRVESGDKPMAGVSTGAKSWTGGAEYSISFEARGNGNLILMATGKGFKRLDPFQNWQKLGEEWKRFRATLAFPPEAETSSFTFFYWQQPGKWFEIRNFKVQ